MTEVFGRTFQPVRSRGARHRAAPPGIPHPESSAAVLHRPDERNGASSTWVSKARVSTAPLATKRSDHAVSGERSPPTNRSADATTP